MVTARETSVRLGLLALTKVINRTSTHLPEVHAVALVEDPLPAVGAVGDGVLCDELGLEHLLCSLRGHLADHDRPLEIHLLQWKKIGVKTTHARSLSLSLSHTSADTHTHLYPTGGAICAPCVVFPLVVQPGKIGLPISFMEIKKKKQ